MCLFPSRLPRVVQDEEFGTEVTTFMHILDDNGKPVEIDLNDDDSETEVETRKNLQKRVLFYLYTRQIDSKKPQVLQLNNVATLKASDFNPKRPTKIVTHGWMNSHRSRACTSIRDAYLKHGDYNIIVVDWSSISLRPYIWASRRVLMIGQYISQMIDFLEAHGMKLSQLTVAGHSLGAHIAGLSARFAKREVHYVVAMDPALPNFITATAGQRVSRDDAKYVQVIHTNAGFLGFLSSLGHVDFYPNGGLKQVGCVIDIGGSCSHSLSYEYFAESINSKAGFLSARCSSYADFTMGMCKTNTALMGGVEPNLNVKGNYYLKTNMKTPYARGVL
ncbi:pancreatic triacylglycerol lipase-like [Andrena cerasifolii]|uniref:pancreatic triacylglycerol lipase-like n=1 Tax=Andrena cerasifolii TaxID=2819439 RepID=UPI004037787B